MKRLLPLFLSALMILLLSGCAPPGVEKPGPDPGTGTDAAGTDTAGTGTETGTETDGTVEEKEIFVRLSASAENVIRLGERENDSDSFLECNGPGSGFEIRMRTEGGTVGVRVTTSGACDFRIWIDGEAQTAPDGSLYFSVTGNRMIEMTGIADGGHTLRVLRVSGGTAEAKLYAAVFRGELLPAESAGRLFVEFLGDEMTAGVRLGGDRDDAALAYSCLTAAMLGSDLAVTAYPGAGTGTLLSSYGTAGNFGRFADIVVLNIGVHDLAAQTDAAVFAERYGELLVSLKKVNTSQCKVVCVVNFADEAYAQAIRETCARLGGETYGYYCYESGLETDGTLTPEEHEALARGLSAYLEQIAPLPVEDNTLQAEENGTGLEIGWNSKEWTKLN